MLPFTKRPNRYEEEERIDTGKVESVSVVPSAPLSMPRPMPSRPPSKAAPPSERHLHAPPSESLGSFLPSFSGDEMTTLMPNKPSSSFPPASARAPRNGRSRPRPNAGLVPRVDDEDRTTLRPNSSASSLLASTPVPAAPPSHPASFTPPAPPSSARGLRINTPPTVIGQAIPAEVRAHAVTAMQTHPSPMPRPMYDSSSSQTDLPVDPPATAVTARTRVLIGRPTVSWAAALVAMGVFVGLVTAIVARGDADSLIDVTASFVDPSQSTAHAAAAQPTPVVALPQAVAPSLPSPVVAAISPPVVTVTAPAVASPAPLPPPVAAVVAEPKSIAATDLPIAKPDVATRAAVPAPEKKAAAVFVAPSKPVSTAPPASRPIAKPQPKADPVAVAAPSKPTPATRPGKKGSNADEDAAAAADRLAREQLEAVLK